MQIFREIAPLRAFLIELKAPDKLIGFVPTMGALHAGHSALINASQQKTNFTVCSIYVNPTQFNNRSDLENYPRTLDADIKTLADAGCDVLFCPSDTELYAEQPSISIGFSGLDLILEGKHRPGHFSGVALIVSKLFHIISPDWAFFGQKDLQQCLIIQKLVNDLNFNINISIVPTVREFDGLAMSSRNMRLNNEERIRATTLFQGLSFAKDALLNGKEFFEIKKAVQDICSNQQVELEYFELLEFSGLVPVDSIQKASEPVLCIAAYVGEVRLIDNMFVKN